MSTDETKSAQASAEGGEITVFLSYAHADEALYGMIRPFKELLGHLVYAKSGRRIKAFLDQDSIGWGEIWQDRLEQEVLGASVFIPLLSASYLDSENCRLEFNRFFSNASALGVRELLLPVLVVHAPAIFNEHSTDDVVRQASARQWEVIEDAVLSDPGSSEWKRTMARIATRFVEALEAAETTIANLDSADLGENGADDDPDPEEFSDEEPGFFELLPAIESNISEVTAASADLQPAIVALGESADQAAQLPAVRNAQQMQAWSLRVARGFEGPAEQISAAGERMLNAAVRLDADVRQLRELAVRLAPVNADLATNYNRMISSMQGLETVTENLNGLVTQMQPAESFSVAIRRALRPARRGLIRVTDTLKLIEAWQLIEVN